MLIGNCVPMAFWKLFQKCVVNLGSLSDTIETGTPCNRTISLHMSRLMAIEACHRPWLALYLGHSWDRSPLSLSQTQRRLILFLIPTSTRIPNAPCVLNLSLSMARAVSTIDSMSCRRRPTISPLIDNFSPFSFS